jgi:hypothetical protein
MTYHCKTFSENTYIAVFSPPLVPVALPKEVAFDRIIIIVRDITL